MHRCYVVTHPCYLYYDILKTELIQISCRCSYRNGIIDDALNNLDGLTEGAATSPDTSCAAVSVGLRASLRPRTCHLAAAPLARPSHSRSRSRVAQLMLMAQRDGKSRLDMAVMKHIFSASTVGVLWGALAVIAAQGQAAPPCL